MSEQEPIDQIDAELREAQARLQAAKEAKAVAELKKLAAIQTQIAENERLKQIEIFAEDELRREQIAKVKAKRKAEEDAKVLKLMEEQKIQAELERMFDAQQEKIRLEREHAQSVQRLLNQAFMEEQDAKRVEAEAIYAANKIKQEFEAANQSDTNNDANGDPYQNHPLRKFIKGIDPPETTTVAPAPSREIDAIEQTKLQAQRDKDTENAEPNAWRVVKRGKGNNFVNSGTSYLLEKEIKRTTGIQANVQRLDLLSSQFDEADLMKALGIAVAEYREKPCSHDGLLFRLESLLLEAEAPHGETQTQ